MQPGQPGPGWQYPQQPQPYPQQHAGSGYPPGYSQWPPPPPPKKRAGPVIAVIATVAVVVAALLITGLAWPGWMTGGQDQQPVEAGSAQPSGRASAMPAPARVSPAPRTTPRSAAAESDVSDPNVVAEAFFDAVNTGYQEAVDKMTCPSGASVRTLTSELMKVGGTLELKAPIRMSDPKATVAAMQVIGRAQGDTANLTGSLYRANPDELWCMNLLTIVQ